MNFRFWQKKKGFTILQKKKETEGGNANDYVSTFVLFINLLRQEMLKQQQVFEIYDFRPDFRLIHIYQNNKSEI